MLVALAAGGVWVECEALLDRPEVDVNHRGVGGYTPLHHAVRHECGAFAQALLERGATPNVIADNGRSPLWLAACYGPTGVLDTLLRAGADANVGAVDGRSPLHVLAMYNIGDGAARLERLLPAVSLACLTAPHEGKSAEQWAREDGHTQLADAILAEVGEVQGGGGGV
jgi:ankyrin repeat protein